MTASPIASVRIFDTVRGTDVVALRSVRSQRCRTRSRDHRAERSSVLGICFWPFIVRQHAPIVHPLLARPCRTALPRERFSPLAQTGGWRSGRVCPLCPVSSDINLFRYCEGIIYFDAEISDRAFDLGMSEKKLDGPEIASSPVNQGSFCAAQ
jgi:hypothetical protein